MTAPVGLSPNVLALTQTMAQGAPESPITDAAQQFDAEADARRQADNEAKRRKALRAIYGEGFPLALDSEPRPSDWKAWADERWGSYTPGVQHNIWTAERNRQFRAGIQWLSRNGQNGQYKEPPMPKDAVRIVDNQIRPALAWQLQIVREQRPGWRFQPTNNDPDRQRKAEAQQLAVEYQFHTGGLRLKMLEAAYWAQTDGVAFLMTHWNPDKGPWEEVIPGEGKKPIGDLDAKVYRIEQVRVSAEATATVPPMLWLVRDVMPKAQAVALYGPDVADEGDASLLASQANQFTSTNQYAYAPLYQNQETVARYTIFCEKSSYLPDGLTCILVGNKVVFGPVGLVMGRVPMVRVTDGSEDPAFYPMPAMNEYIAPQVRVNMLLSKLYESIRVNAGGRFLSKSGAIVTETLIGGQLSAIEVRGSGPLGDAVQPVAGFSVGNDVMASLQLERKNLSDRSGWNDAARGQFTADQSGRAILAIREQLERTFAPFVAALCDGMVEWAKQAVGWMRWGYRIPRSIGILGENRPDLARELESADFDAVVDVQVDPETLMPMPRALRLWLLEDAFQKGVITPEQYKRALPFGWVQSIASPDDTQEARAKRIAEQLRQGQPPEPVLWQDDEKIHQDVLERDLILAGDIPQEVRDAALARWDELAKQATEKSGTPPPQRGTPDGDYQILVQTVQDRVKQVIDTMLSQDAQQVLQANALLPAPAAPAGAPPGEGGEGMPPSEGSAVNGGPRPGLAMDPAQAPIFGASPSVAAAPAAMREATDQDMAAALFERSAPQ